MMKTKNMIIYLFNRALPKFVYFNQLHFLKLTNLQQF